MDADDPLRITFPDAPCRYCFRQRKELALVDLEDSYHTEFGSVDLR